MKVFITRCLNVLGTAKAEATHFFGTCNFIHSLFHTPLKLNKYTKIASKKNSVDLKDGTIYFLDRARRSKIHVQYSSASGFNISSSMLRLTSKLP